MTQLPPLPPGADAPVATIGEIGVSHQSVWLPTGQYPIRGSVWTVTDNSRETEKIATLGIILAVIGMFLICLLSLLFLLMKEKRITGSIQVTVQGDGFHFTTSVPADSRLTMQHVTQQVNWARSVAAAV